jgi:transcriptional antiterminator RfaH
MSKNWYAMRSKPRREDSVWKQMLGHGFETYYPRIRVHPINPRSKKIRAYFPGYLFVRVDLEETGLNVFRWMPHSIGLVSFDNQPAVVPDHLIYTLQKRVGEINEAGGELFDGLEPGDRVRIAEGPFKGYEAIFDERLPGKERVRVLLELLGNERAVTLELDAGQIKKS